MLEILANQQQPRFPAYILLRMLPATRWSLNHWRCFLTHGLAEHLTATCTEAFCAKAAKKVVLAGTGSTFTIQIRI